MIGEYVFAENTKLAIVSLPENLTSLDDYAFEGSSGFSSLIFCGDAPLSDLDLLGFVKERQRLCITLQVRSGMTVRLLVFFCSPLILSPMLHCLGC